MQKKGKKKLSTEEKIELLRSFSEQANEFKEFLKSAEEKYCSSPKNSMSKILSDCSGERTFFNCTPTFIKGTLLPHQISGLNWLIYLKNKKINGILGDEMGLGKTVQAISLVAYCKYCEVLDGVSLIVCPKLALKHWENEFKNFCPGIKVVVVIGDKDERRSILKKRIISKESCVDVILTTYEQFMIERCKLRKIKYNYFILDEAHRIKNERCRFLSIFRQFHFDHLLFLTGTPLQNNLRELWTIFSCLLPHLFSANEDFTSWFGNPEEVGEDHFVNQIKSIIQPIILRRMKSDVVHDLLPKKETMIYVGLTELQRKLYAALLMKDIDVLNGIMKCSARSLCFLVMQLRKCCNHPYIFQHVRNGDLHSTGEHLIENTAKMIVLDKLLDKLYKNKNRVLIFSQMEKMIRLLEEYMDFRGYAYCSITGKTRYHLRQSQIDDFNKNKSPYFAFLLTTRAGGLGINLASADVVILYDSDWNPHSDLQAMDRAHRIGQKKQVSVFRFVTSNTVEERMIEIASIKLKLDAVLMKNGELEKPAIKRTTGMLLSVATHGAQEIISSTGSMLTDNDIDRILAESAVKTEEFFMKVTDITKEKSKCEELLGSSSNHGSFDKNANRELRSRTRLNVEEYITLPKRKRHSNYFPEEQINNPRKLGTLLLNNSGSKKNISLYDFQFYPKELYDLVRKEMSKKMDRTPISDEELKLRNSLLDKGFSNWSRNDYLRFIKGIEEYGPKDITGISSTFKSKTAEEVEKYHATFMVRWTELSDFKTIEKYMAAWKPNEDIENSISQKVAQHNYPIIQSRKTTKGFGNLAFSEEQDRILLVYLHQIGTATPGVYDEILKRIRQNPRFYFDWFLRSRTSEDIRRRCKQLLLAM